MPKHVLTEVSARVEPDREADLLAAFSEALATPLPDGLLRTELLHGSEGQWRIQTLWRDREALEAMRAGPEPPTAPRVFRHVGAEPTLRIYEVETEQLAPSARP